MKTREAPLPDYERPPVIEVVCGIQYAPLKDFRATTFGLFWQAIRADYVTVEEVVPLSPVIESLSSAPEPARARLELFDSPPLPRLFFLHREHGWLLQLQQDRFLHNWRKENEEDVRDAPLIIAKKFGIFVAVCDTFRPKPVNADPTDLDNEYSYCFSRIVDPNGNIISSIKDKEGMITAKIEF